MGSSFEMACSLAGLITHISWSIPWSEALIARKATTPASRETNTDGRPLASIQVSLVSCHHRGATALRKCATTDLPTTGIRDAPRMPLPSV